jgi:hypothetical protein
MVSPLLQQFDVPLSIGLHANEAIGRSHLARILRIVLMPVNFVLEFETGFLRASERRPVRTGVPGFKTRQLVSMILRRKNCADALGTMKP